MDIKSGAKTSEFYLTLVSLIVSLLVMAGVIEPSRASEATELITQVIGGIVAAITIVSWIIARTDLKKTQLENIPSNETGIQG